MAHWYAEYFELKELGRPQTQGLSLWTLSCFHLLLVPLFPLKQIVENTILLLQARTNSLELFFGKGSHKSPYTTVSSSWETLIPKVGT